jgi:tetratricopeptide (TPR) repeat protein
VNSKRSDAHFNLGVTLKEQGRLDEAVDSYRRAIALKPDYADAHNNLGMTLKDLGHLDEAADRLTTALRYETGSAEIFYNLSLLKRFKTGDELIEKMHRLYRSDKLNEQQKLGFTHEVQLG